MLGLSPHPGVSYLFQNQTQASATDDALWNVALGSTALGEPIGSSVLSSPPPSWTPALGELVLKVDSKFKVRLRPSFFVCLDAWRLKPLFFYTQKIISAQGLRRVCVE